MEPIDLLLVAAVSWTELVIFVGTVMCVVYRKKPIVRSTMPLINLLVDSLYAGMVAFSFYQSVWHDTFCFVYLWYPFIFLFCLGNSYMVKTWKVYVLAITGALNYTEFQKSKSMEVDVPEPITKYNMTKIELDDLKNDDKKDTFVRKSICTPIDKWVYNHKWLANSKSLIMLFLSATIAEMSIPLTLQLTLHEYNHPLALCSERTNIEMGFFLGFLVFYSGLYLVTFLRIRNHREYYGIRRQLFFSALGWFLVLVLFVILLVIGKYVHSPHIAYAFSVSSIICWLFPFTADTLWPLFRSQTNKEILKLTETRTSKLGIQELVKWKKNQEQIGWETLAAFMNEHFSLAEAKENQFLLHSLFFIREFILKKEDLEEFRPAVLEDEDTLDQELCAFAFIIWMKYLHKKGEFSWEKTNEDALFLIEAPEIEAVRKEIEGLLSNMTAIKNPDSLDVRDMKKAGRKLRQTYEIAKTNLEKRIISKFKESIQFENFLHALHIKQ